MVMLCVVDVQNDFCHPDGFFAKNFHLDVSGVEPVVRQIEKVLHFWRDRGLKVVWTQAIGSSPYLSATQEERYCSSGKLGFLREKTWGSDFFRIRPRGDEPVFKKGGYDPFSNPSFKKYLIGQEEVIIVGFFSDVCVGATAHTADSLGIRSSVIRECSLPMFYPYEESLRYMQIYFGTRVLNIEDVIA